MKSFRMTLIGNLRDHLALVIEWLYHVYCSQDCMVLCTVFADLESISPPDLEDIDALVAVSRVVIFCFSCGRYLLFSGTGTGLILEDCFRSLS